VHVIPNWVTLESDDSTSDNPEPRAALAQRVENGTRVALGVGRLDPQKGFDLLIDAFARVAARHPSWRLVILGEGPARAELTAVVAARGMGERIAMPGFTPTARALMRQAALFVLSSRFEGMPNALIEAMSEGLACASFDCQTGPGELIDHGVNGWLVPAGDAVALAVALDVLMGDDALRTRLGARAREIKEAHSQRAIFGLWNALLTEVTGRSGWTRTESYAARRDG
jgi:glycosyltransferase involved in cell wall biosynthesis